MIHALSGSTGKAKLIMTAKKFIVELDEQERARLYALISKGKARRRRSSRRGSC
jgi:hypothetical protein